jgi:hypothetical protein
MAATLLTDIVLQGTSAVFTMLLKKEDDSVLGVSELAYLRLSYFDKETQSIINNRDEQNSLNVNNVTVDSDGLVTWTMQILDSVIIDNRKELERHRAIFEWSWGVGKVAKHEIEFDVGNTGMSSL